MIIVQIVAIMSLIHKITIEKYKIPDFVKKLKHSKRNEEPNISGYSYPSYYYTHYYCEDGSFWTLADSYDRKSLWFNEKQIYNGKIYYNSYQIWSEWEIKPMFK